jgi:hypothetical protein
MLNTRWKDGLLDSRDTRNACLPNDYRDDGKCPGMSQWSSLKARLVLAALIRIGWRGKRQNAAKGLIPIRGASFSNEAGFKILNIHLLTCTSVALFFYFMKHGKRIFLIAA